MTWTSYTYGELPSRAVFNKHYRAMLGDRDYEIRAGASGTLADWEGDYDADELWDALQAAVADEDAWDMLEDGGGEDPLSVVSSILYTLKIEWT